HRRDVLGGGSDAGRPRRRRRPEPGAHLSSARPDPRRIGCDRRGGRALGVRPRPRTRGSSERPRPGGARGDVRAGVPDLPLGWNARPKDEVPPPFGRFPSLGRCVMKAGTSLLLLGCTLALLSVPANVAAQLHLDVTPFAGGGRQAVSTGLLPA